MLSNGMNLLLEDQRKILPLLTVFAALFRYALFSVYDSDFYGNDTGEINFIICRQHLALLLASFYFSSMITNLLYFLI